MGIWTPAEIQEAIQLADAASEKHYQETLQWCAETGVPTYWIAKPASAGKVAPTKPIIERPKGTRRRFTTDRSHKKGHGRKEGDRLTDHYRGKP